MYISRKLLNLLPGPMRALVKKHVIGDGQHKHSQHGALMAFLVRVVSAGIAFFSQVLLARWIGAHEYGIFTYVWVWVNITGTLCAAGFAVSVVRFVPQYTSQNDFAHVRGFLRTGRLFSVIAGILSTIAGLAILFLFDGLFTQYMRIPLAIALIAVPAFALTDFQDGVGRSQGWIDLALIPPYILRPFLLFVYIGGAVALGWARDAQTAAYAAVLATWVTAFIQYILQKKRMKKAVPPGERRYRFWFWLKVSLPVIAIESFALMMTNMDIVLLKLFVTPDQIAMYYAAARTIALIAFVHFAVVASVTPKFSTLYASGQLDELTAMLKQTRHWTFWPSLAGGVGLLVLGKPLLWLFGPEFTAAYPTMFILVIGLLARSFAGPLQGLVIATGRQNMAALVMGAAVTVNLVLNVTLIPEFGLPGAAVATACSYCIESVLLFLVTRKALEQRPSVSTGKPHGSPAQ